MPSLLARTGNHPQAEDCERGEDDAVQADKDEERSALLRPPLLPSWPERTATAARIAIYYWAACGSMPPNERARTLSTA
jgi:hypothetical protein